MPHGRELFSSAGSLPDAKASPLAYAFPNVLSFFDPPWFVAALLLFAVAASLLLAVGLHDRVAAVFLWYVWACLFGRNPLIGNPGLPVLGLPAARPRLPAEGALRLARGAGAERPWRRLAFPPDLFAVAWILMAVGYSYSGLTKLASPSWTDGSALARVLDNPLARPGFIREAVAQMPDLLLRAGTWGALLLEALFAPLALLRRARPWLWLTLLGLHLSLILLIDVADLSLGMVMLHLFTFDPAWVRGKDGPVERLFYDGSCALCHGAVRFVLAEDPEGRVLAVRAPRERGLPRRRSRRRSGSACPTASWFPRPTGACSRDRRECCTSSSASAAVWRVLAILGRLVPAGLRDAAYDLVARVRYRFFGRKDDACPFIPAALRGRFDL